MKSLISYRRRPMWLRITSGIVALIFGWQQVGWAGPEEEGVHWNQVQGPGVRVPGWEEGNAGCVKRNQWIAGNLGVQGHLLEGDVNGDRVVDLQVGSTFFNRQIEDGVEGEWSFCGSWSKAGCQHRRNQFYVLRFEKGGYRPIEVRWGNGVSLYTLIPLKNPPRSPQNLFAMAMPPRP